MSRRCGKKGNTAVRSTRLPARTGPSNPASGLPAHPTRGRPQPWLRPRGYTVRKESAWRGGLGGRASRSMVSGARHSPNT